ncbi:MAG: hypothetical protein ABEJ57_07025 [Halobacteriaceae archaeon]
MPTRRHTLRLLGTAAAATLGATGVGVADPATASVTFEDQHAHGAALTVDSVTLPHGGFVVLHDPGQDNEVIGHTQALPAGTHHDVTLAIKRVRVDKDRRGRDRTLLAMAHRDTGIEGKYEFPDDDPPYFVGGTPVVDLGDVTF